MVILKRRGSGERAGGFPLEVGEENETVEEQRQIRRFTRRRFLKTLGGLSGVAGVSYVAARGIGFEGGTASVSSGPGDPRRAHGLEAFAGNVRSGGPPKDGIPSIDEPRFVAADEAAFLSDDSVVFGIVRGDEVRAYPQLVLVWHEIVNDRFADGPLSITYCPLTGSVVGFRGTAPGGEAYTFGTSGDLVNSNLLMYDRQTDSRWPQILGQAITGASRGRRLEEIPLEWTTWGRWRTTHPATSVLSTDTGHLRSYGTDPYGSYTPLSGYYKDRDLFFPVMRKDPRFGAKEVFLGAKHGPTRAAVKKGLLREKKALPAPGEENVVFLYDPGLDEGRAFLARMVSGLLRFIEDGPGRYVDSITGSAWDPWGRAVAGPLQGSSLERIISYDVMWFAWAAFFPETEVAG